MNVLQKIEVFMLKRLVVAIALMIVVSGCGGKVKTDVSSFHMMPQGLQGKTFYIFPCEKESSYLECNSYLDMVKGKLKEKGMNEGEIQNSDYYFFVSYDINGKSYKSSVPIYGQTGVSSSYTYGTVSTSGNYGTYSGTTVNTPQFGVVSRKKVERTTYIRALYVDVYAPGKEIRSVPEKVYEGKAISKGSTDNLSIVMPVIVESLLEDFPGKSGETRTVIKKLKDR